MAMKPPARPGDAGAYAMQVTCVVWQFAAHFDSCTTCSFGLTTGRPLPGDAAARTPAGVRVDRFKSAVAHSRSVLLRLPMARRAPSGEYSSSDTTLERSSS